MKDFLTMQVQNQKVKNLVNKTILYISMLFLLTACKTTKVHKQNTLEEEAYELARTFLNDFVKEEQTTIVYFIPYVHDIHTLEDFKAAIISFNEAYAKGEIENIRPCEEMIYKEYPFDDALSAITFKEWDMKKLKVNGIIFKEPEKLVGKTFKIGIPYINKARDKAIFLGIDAPDGGLLYYYEKVDGKWLQKCSYYYIYI